MMEEILFFLLRSPPSLVRQLGVGAAGTLDVFLDSVVVGDSLEMVVVSTADDDVTAAEEVAAADGGVCLAILMLNMGTSESTLIVANSLQQ